MVESPKIDESPKINKLLEIIEFEIQFATDQIGLLKKDNINFILLIFALIGFLTLVPMDVFIYEWFGSGLFPLILWLILLLWITYSYRKNRCSAMNEYYNIVSEKKRDSVECSKCESVDNCTLIVDDEKIERFLENIKIHVFRHYLFSINSFFYIITFFFGVLLFSYICCALLSIINPAFFIYKPNSIIVILLSIESLLFLAYFIFNKKFTAVKANCKSNQFLIYIIFLALILIAIETFGTINKIPPVIGISNNTQISTTLLTHFQNFPFTAISLIILVYQNLFFLVMYDQFNTNSIIGNLDKKISELMELKSKINLIQLNLREPVSFSELYKEFLMSKTPTYFSIPIFGIFSIPFLHENLTPSEITELIRLS